MKKSKSLLSVCFLLLSYLCVSCEVEYMDFNAPTIDISPIESENPEELSILFTPSSGTAIYKYAITRTGDFSTFTDGSMAGIETVQGEESKVANFKDLIPGTTYYIYAQAFNAENQSGGLATRRITFADKNEVSVNQEYNLSTSAAFRIGYPSQYIQCRYLLGKAGDRDAFLRGEAPGEEQLNELAAPYVVSFFDLEPETDYVFYAQATNIIGANSELFEMPFTTPAKDAAPYAEFEIVHNDLFREHYRLTPNAQCSKIICVFNRMGAGAEGLVYGLGWNGDWMGIIQGWYGANLDNPDFRTYAAAAGLPVEIVYNDYSFSANELKSMQAVLFDESGQNAIGVQYWSFETADRPKTAETAHVSIEISEITTSGATYTYVADENTLGYYFDTVDADWWDKNKEHLLSQDEFYLQNLLKADHIFAYPADDENRTRIFQEMNGTLGTRYYAIACPVNAKGPGAGWEDVVMVEYTTLAE